MHPSGLKDHEFFSKRNWIYLRPKSHELSDYYLKCSRCVDKEDWYLALVQASQFEQPTNKNTQFDPAAMKHLISTVHRDPKQLEPQWLNALLGRLFLSIYKTERVRQFFYQKVMAKVAKLNARRPSYLEEITLRSVDGGHAAPILTQPRLIHLSPQGEYTCEMHVAYQGCFRVELETVLKWTYSDRLPPIHIQLVLAITLKSLEGKMMIKIKEPPTNRAWYGFYQSPKMDWVIEPVVWEKRIGYSVVSKMIQARIEDIFKESLVLPNMDDIVFFDTDGMGGIFDKQDQELQPKPSPTPTLSGEPVNNSSLPKKDWFNRHSEPLDQVTTKVDVSLPIFITHKPSHQALRSLMSATVKRGQSIKKTPPHFPCLNQSNSPTDYKTKKTSSLFSLDDVCRKKEKMEKPSRLRSKSSPITALTEINVVHNGILQEKK